MNDAEKLRRASEADRLLREPLLVEALDAIEHEAIEGLLRVTDASAMDPDKMRRLLCDRVNVIRDLRQHIHAVISQGKAAARTWEPA